MLFFSTGLAANAATLTSPYPGGAALQSYWSLYNAGIATTTQPIATPTTPQPTTQPTTPPATNPAPGSTSGLSADEQLMFDLVNQERVKAGLSAYTVDMRLVTLARQKSQDMYVNNYFSHISPTYGSALDMEKKAGISARVMGAENIAKAATTQRAEDLFMGSAGHKANILNPLHTAIGIGIVSTPNGVVVTQLFMGN